MKRLRLAFLIILISVLAAMSTTAAALAARPTRQPFSAMIQSGPPISIGRSWVDGKGIYHVRDMVLDGTITGDINGQMRITQNFNIDPSTFTGNIQAKAVITATSGAAYQMLACITVENTILSGISIIYGAGSLKGTQVIATVSGTAGGVATLNGIQFVTKP